MSRADTSGTFLHTFGTITGSVTSSSSARGGATDPEAMAKHALQFLSVAPGHMDEKDLGYALNLTSEQVATVIGLLTKSGLVTTDEGHIRLTPYGKDVLGMFSLA